MNILYYNQTAVNTYALINSGTTDHLHIHSIRIPNEVFDCTPWAAVQGVEKVEQCHRFSEVDLALDATDMPDALMLMGIIQDRLDELAASERIDQFQDGWVFPCNIERTTGRVIHAQ